MSITLLIGLLYMVDCLDVRKVILTYYRQMIIKNSSVMVQVCAVVEAGKMSSKISIMDALHTNLFVIEINFIPSILMRLEKR